MKAIVLLSAGLDSLVNTAAALGQGIELEALTFDYGQKAARKEVHNSREICRHYCIKHHVIELPWYRSLTRTALVGAHAAIPDFERSRLDDTAYAQETARAVWVPNRNGVFINIAAAFAESQGQEAVIVGFNWEEAQTFPDNTASFMSAATTALGYSTASGVRVTSYTVDMDKRAIVRLGRELKVPFELCWPCYRDGEKPCGTCESCVRFRRAYEEDSL